MSVANSTSTKPEFMRLVARDGWLLASLITIIVVWGIALLNMAGFNVSRGRSGNLSADAGDWVVMLGLAIAASVLGITLIAWRMRFWKYAQTAMATVLHIEPYRGDTANGYALQYQYEVNGHIHRGKTTFGRNSVLTQTQAGDSFTVFFDPAKLHASRVVA